MGDYKSAEPYYKQALEIYKKALGEEHPDYAMSLNNLGVLYSEMGDYKSAEPYYKEGLEIYKKALGENHTDYAGSLINLGILYSDMGDYKSAEPYYKQALEIRRKALGVDHPDYAMSLNSLGNLYLTMGDYKSAEPYYKQALEIIRKALGEDHPDYAMSLNNLGVLYREMGDYKSAEPYYKQALEIYKKALGEDHPYYASSLNSLGNLYLKMGDYKSAEPHYKQALEIRRKALGVDHPDYAMSLNNLGVLFTEMRNYKAAEQYYSKSFSVKLSILNSNFSWLSAQEKVKYWQQQKYFFEKMNGFSALASDSVYYSTVLSYNANLISKSLLLETSRELDQALAASTDVEMKAQFAEMKQLRRTYNKMRSEGGSNKEIMERYKTEADSLDKILVNKLGEYAASKRKFEITWKDIQSNLSANEAAIEYARYYDDKDSAYKYLALVVRPGYEYPELVKLGKEEDIRLANQPNAHDFASLYDLAWRGIDSLLVGVNTVYYSPAGELNNVSFAALCFEAGDSLLTAASAPKRGVLLDMEGAASQSCNAVLMDKYTLHQLTTTRYLADGTLKKNRALNSTITLLGGINYSDVPSADKNATHEESEQDFALNVNLTNRGHDKRGKRSSSGIGKPMKYLEGTHEEVTHIATQLNGSWSVQTMSDRNASEHSLKWQLETKSPGVLHIATHGFAFPDEERDDSHQLLMDEKPTYRISDDPMVRCGLMLSGSNISWTGNPKKMIEQTGEDGILTAAEVANLDLSNTKLVVLSACETGLGKIKGSEGTFGLKRGFKLAGVEQMIVSLWSVPDKETMELMTLFYTDLTKTLNPVVSFEKAQKQMRTNYPTEPEKWAGFVLVR
jgi:tetratricopeptide (TPR) repeat protein